MVTCPRRSETTLGCTPACSAKVACVCLRSCKRICGQHRLLHRLPEVARDALGVERGAVLLREDEAGLDPRLVFAQENGAALDPESVSRYFRQAVKQSMLPQIRLHDLRHTHATLALQAGVHPKVVSERLGHVTIAITLDTYSHAIPAMQEAAAALIAELVFTAEQRPA